MPITKQPLNCLKINWNERPLTKNMKYYALYETSSLVDLYDAINEKFMKVQADKMLERCEAYSIKYCNHAVNEVNKR